MARYDDEDYNEISTGEWIVSLILSYIPLIGLIMLLVWAFGGGTSPTKANWAKAQLQFITLVVYNLSFFCVHDFLNFFYIYISER